MTQAADKQSKPCGVPIWTEGVCGDGAAILRDGQLMKIEDVLTALNELEEYRADDIPCGEPTATDFEWVANKANTIPVTETETEKEALKRLRFIVKQAHRTLNAIVASPCANTIPWGALGGAVSWAEELIDEVDARNL